MPERKIAVADDLILDFSGLFDVEAAPEPPESPVEPLLVAGAGIHQRSRKSP